MLRRSEEAHSANAVCALQKSSRIDIAAMKKSRFLDVDNPL